MGRAAVVREDELYLTPADPARLVNLFGGELRAVLRRLARGRVVGADAYLYAARGVVAKPMTEKSTAEATVTLIPSGKPKRKDATMTAKKKKKK